VKRRLLDLVVCPRCHGVLDLEVFKEEAVVGGASGTVACSRVCAWRGTAVTAAVSAEECRRCYALDVIEGALACGGCRARFPIINGVPRLLRPALLAQVQRRYPDFFARHPEFLVGAAPASDPLADTLESFTRQRLDLRPPGPEFAHQWTEHLRRNLGGAARVEDLRGSLILDVGCGFGRHLYVASEAGAEAVGVDLSGGVDVARRNNLGHPRCHIVQADVYDRPFREESFDLVWSFGVLHHMPDPRGGFAAIAPFAKADGGRVVIWVYGYRGMSFTYRLSHMRALHRVSRTLSDRARVRVSQAVAALLSALYWEPLRLAKRIGLRRAVERLPLAEYVDHGWISRVAGVHDRLSTPITHFHDRDELREWFEAARLEDVRVEDTNRRGWRAHGRRPAAALAAAPR
jgi:SAM-dependent methyltransferase